MARQFAKAYAVLVTILALWAWSITATNVAQVAKNYDVVFSGEIGVFVNFILIGINEMISMTQDYPTTSVRLCDTFGV